MPVPHQGDSNSQHHRTTYMLTYTSIAHHQWTCKLMTKPRNNSLMIDSILMIFMNNKKLSKVFLYLGFWRDRLRSLQTIPIRQSYVSDWDSQQQQSSCNFLIVSFMVIAETDATDLIGPPKRRHNSIIVYISSFSRFAGSIFVPSEIWKSHFSIFIENSITPWGVLF